MKISGKNVVIATKKLCIKYTSKIHGGFGDCVFGSNDYKCSVLEKDIIFVKDKNGYYVELEDLKSLPNLTLICYGAAPRWKTSPRMAGDKYIDDIKPYFDSKVNQEKLFDVKTLFKILTIEKKIDMEEQQISVN